MITTETATLAGGCFWCTEAIFQRLNGVQSVMPGYAGGAVENPSYEQVSTGKTGHAEAIQIVFDPSVISYDTLLDIFWATHDPTQMNRQGADVGPQYRSAVFAHSAEQKKIAEAHKAALAGSGKYRDPIVTEVVPFTTFTAAEPYHRDFYAKNPQNAYCIAVIDPKIQKLMKEFSKDVAPGPT
jgi:peptide-methionine (S)-S-oxide reductase